MTKHHLKASKSKHGLADDIGKPGIIPALSTTPSEPLGLKRRHFMGTALALDAAALLAACGGGGGGGDAAAGGGSGSGSSSGSTSSSASSSASGSVSSSSSGTSSSSSSNSGSSSGSGSGSGSAAPTNWVVSTLAGTGASTPLTNGTGGTATFNIPYGVAVDTSGNVFVADINNQLIRKITPAGAVSTLAGTTGASGLINGQGNTSKFYGPTWIAVDGSGYLYVADLFNHRIRKITQDGVVSNWAGSGFSGYLDGTVGTARFYNPTGVALDTNGNLYLADSYNHLIRKITPGGEVSTLAGVTLTMGYLDGTGGTAKFNSPSGIAVDTSGYVYVADYDNHLIRKISPAGVVSTLAGIGGTSGFANGTGGSATFNNPTGIALDANGTLYVAEQTNHRIRKISPLGVVSTLAGVGSAGNVNGTGETAKFDSPSGIAIDTSGNLYVGDKSNNLVRKITPIYL